MADQPRMIQLSMAGERPFYRRDVLLAVLRALRTIDLLAPDRWGLDEHSSHPYDEERAALVANGEPSQYILQLRRTKRIRQTTFIRLSEQPGLSVTIPPKTPKKDWPPLFELGDPLAEAYQPDVGWVHVFSTIEPPLDGDEERDRYLMDAGVTGSGREYYEVGPGGLGLRTYVGPRVVDLFGRERLLATPAAVTELSWGGVRIDLVDEPWHADEAKLLAAWRAAMEHLRPAGVFARIELDDEGAFEIDPGERFPLETR